MAVPLLLFFSGATFIHAENLLKNPGFEEGLANWVVTPSGSPRIACSEEAASIGKMGLRCGAVDSDARASVSTEKFPVQAGQIYRATFWGRAVGPSSNLTVLLVFTDDKGKAIPAANTPGYWPGSTVGGDDAFEQSILQGAAPEGAAFVSVTMTFRGKGKDWVDVDDFSLELLAPEMAVKKPLPPPIPVEPILEEIKTNPTRGKTPPRIVLKLDDLGGSWSKGPMKQIHHNWQRIGKFAEERKIKVSMGVVAKGLEDAGPDAFEWIKRLNNTGLVEFWLHGYDHAGWTAADGKAMPEGRGRSVEEQTQRQALCQKIAEEKLGFHFASFGPTGSGPAPSHDAALLEGLHNDPFMTSILYPAPMDDMARALQARGKVTVLSRVWSVNLEGFVGHPRFDLFLQGYAHNRGRSYFILQGHPAAWGWDDTDKNVAYGDFLKIVNFLTAQGATFVTPTECAAFVKSTGSPVADTKSNQAP